MLITSLDNKKIKLIKSLKNVKERRKLSLFLIEGKHLLIEALKTNLVMDIFIVEGNELNLKLPIEPMYVTTEIMRKISSLNSTTVVLAICKMPDNHLIKGNHILLLDDIQDPGNLGTIIRSSVAFNVDTIVLSPNTVDLYNDKVIRSTQGMLFNINIITMDLLDAIKVLKKEYLILGTDVKNGCNVSEINSSKYALIMGNEGNGINDNIKQLCDKNLYIKMNPLCESLNVGVATSILLYELEK